MGLWLGTRPSHEERQVAREVHSVIMAAVAPEWRMPLADASRRQGCRQLMC